MEGVSSLDAKLRVTLCIFCNRRCGLIKTNKSMGNIDDDDY
jgi:hypothetical protein